MRHVRRLTFDCLRSLARSSTTTMVIDAKNGDAGSVSPRGSKKTFTDELCSTFSSPLAWILVLALIITWSCVFVIMFDLTDFKTVSGEARALALASETLELPVLNLLTKNKVKKFSPCFSFSLAFSNAFCVWDNLSEMTGSVFSTYKMKTNSAS